jgi:leader peptidase (prepilin peptidase)/N-methyltransferase
MELFMLSIAVVSGLILGSFFNVCIWRIPRGESIAFPASHCPSCSRPIRPWENIPVISYLLLGGKCRGCKVRISWRYPMVELLTCVLSVIIWYYLLEPFCVAQHTASEWTFMIIKIISLIILVPITFIDLSHYIIPDSFTLWGLAIGILVSFLPGNPTPLNMLYGIAAGGGSLYALGIFGEIAFKKGEAMGGGDIKLMAFLGAVWGWEIAFMTIIFGSVLGAVSSIPLFILKRMPQERRIPFGPFLAAGMWIAVLWGKQLVHAYFELIGRMM